MGEYVMVPRDTIEEICATGCYLPQTSSIISTLNEILAKPAEQHQGEPVALPVRNVGFIPSHIQVHGDPWKFVQGWNACVEQIEKLGPLYTHPAPAAPGEVERLRDDLATVKADRDAYAQNAIDLQRRVQNADLALKVQTQNCDTLRAQLAERDALLREALGHAQRLEPMSVSCFNRIDTALSASADTSAPMYPKCTVLKDANVRYSNSTAPVERDERAEFEKHYASKNDGFVPPFFDGQYDWHDAQPCWEAWQTRAALERKS